MNLFVKICGITRPQDAELAGRLGAAAVGFIFWPGSPRWVEPEVAKGLAAAVPPEVMKVGVFVDEDIDNVVRVVQEIGLDAAQLHGHETPEYCRELKVRLKPDSTIRQRAIPIQVGSGFSRTIIKAIRLKDNETADVSGFDADVVMLVDAHDAERHGGTGRAVNWDSARAIACTRPTILAGGLKAANVRLAVQSVRPYGVDVSSGVESAPGVKDPVRLRSFFEALHE